MIGGLISFLEVCVTKIFDFSENENITFNKADLYGKDFGLVRDEGNEIDGLTDRYWAYVKGGKLPEYFSDSMGVPIKIKVPKRFHAILNQYLK